MTQSKKTGRKRSGKIHTSRVVEPSDQSAQAPGRHRARMASTEKPDFDERERRLSPQRKAMGPDKRRDRSVPSAADATSDKASKPVSPTQVEIEPGKAEDKS